MQVEGRSDTEMLEVLLREVASLFVVHSSVSCLSRILLHSFTAYLLVTPIYRPMAQDYPGGRLQGEPAAV